MPKEIVDMTDTELKQAYREGCTWLEDNEQMPSTDQNMVGRPYDPEMYLLCLKRFELINEEINKRGLKI
jgi:hypothetical protein